MQTYVGYGFNTDAIEGRDWLALVEKYDNEKFDNYLKSHFGDNITETDKIESAIRFAEQRDDFRSSYLCDIINSEESKKAGTDYIVSGYDNFLVFDSVRFADDSKRTEYIRNADDFIAMIGRYVPTGNLTFGNLYEGTDWNDPVYELD